ncbi:hypothetical protein Tco_0337580 [Tanacetum coccineum]
MYPNKGGRKQKENQKFRRDPLFDVLPEDKIDHMETKNAQSKGRIREMVDEVKDFDKDRLSTEDGVSTVKEGVSTDFEKVLRRNQWGSEEIFESTGRVKKAKAASKEKEKGVELKDVEDIDRPRPTSTRSLLTLKPLPKIDPKDKGKKKIEEKDESESEDEEIPQAGRNSKQLESDERNWLGKSRPIVKPRRRKKQDC